MNSPLVLTSVCAARSFSECTSNSSGWKSSSRAVGLFAGSLLMHLKPPAHHGYTTYMVRHHTEPIPRGDMTGLTETSWKGGAIPLELRPGRGENAVTGFSGKFLGQVSARSVFPSPPASAPWAGPRRYLYMKSFCRGSSSDSTVLAM